MTKQQEALGCILSNAVVIAGKELADAEETITRLAVALDTACNLLAVVGSRAEMLHAKITLTCGNCGNPWDSDDPGNPDAHDDACDIPDVFRIRDEYQAAQERAEEAHRG